MESFLFNVACLSSFPIFVGLEKLRMKWIDLRLHQKFLTTNPQCFLHTFCYLVFFYQNNFMRFMNLTLMPKNGLVSCSESLFLKTLPASSTLHPFPKFFPNLEAEIKNSANICRRIKSCGDVRRLNWKDSPKCGTILLSSGYKLRLE